MRARPPGRRPCAALTPRAYSGWRSAALTPAPDLGAAVIAVLPPPRSGAAEILDGFCWKKQLPPHSGCGVQHRAGKMPLTAADARPHPLYDRTSHPRRRGQQRALVVLVLLMLLRVVGSEPRQANDAVQAGTAADDSDDDVDYVDATSNAGVPVGFQQPDDSQSPIAKPGYWVSPSDPLNRKSQL